MKKLWPLIIDKIECSDGSSSKSSENEPFKSSSVGNKVGGSLMNIINGSISGCVGVSAVYPIDLVKTRMQNMWDTGSHSKQRLHKSGIACAINVVRNEGLFKLYSGLGVQLLGGEFRIWTYV